MAQLHNQQSSSRLNRLLTLLDTGSTQATRFAAARQIGDIAKTHPNELNALLNKVSKYLRSRNWDTRVAAAHAIGAIAEKSKRTSLSDLYSSLEKKISEAGISFSVEELCPKDVSCVSFRSFDITKVLDFGALLASGGQEYDISADNTKNSKERLARQKRNLKKRLGLDVCEKFMDVDDMIRDEDLVHNFDTQGSKMIQGFRSKRPSARELNLLKRKAKVKDHVVKDMEISGPQSLGSEKAQPADIDTKPALDSPMGDDIREHEGDGRFPFDCFIEQLILDMFDPAWEVRHGSVMALREILTYQGAYIGVCPPEMASPCHQLSRDLSDEYELPVKREREIDPTPEVSEDGSVLDPKRPKLEAIALGSFPVSRNLEHNGFVFPSVQVSSGADVGSAFLSVQGNRGADVRAAFPTVQVTSVADVGSASPSVQVNSIADAGSAFPSIQANSTDVGSALSSMPVNTVADVDSVVIKTEPCLDGGKSMCGEGLDAVVSVQLCEDKASAGGVGVLKNSGNVELMNFVNLTQNSWRKNSGFLQDCAIRFLCVLSLDRFGDYVSDQVVAPVRETCAQALGAVLKYMAPELVHQTLNILLQMQNRPEWEIRHGGLLGIKYLVAVRREMLSDLLGFVLPACKAGLEDPDDDVRAVAADALIPAASAIVSLQGHTLRTIVMLLWDILLDLDDLSPSTSSVMNLLSEIYSHDDMILNILDARQGQDLDLNEISLLEDHLAESASEENPCMLSVLAPRLWPFMRHIITTVRYSAIRTLERLLEAAYRRHISDCASGSFWPSFILADTLRIVFQNMLLESNEDILQCTERVWRLLLCCPIKDLEAAAAPFISSWLELATTPYGSALDTAKMFWPVGTPRKSHVKAAAKMRTMVPENDAFRSMRMDGSRGTGTEESSGQASATVKLVVGADFEKSVTQTRVVATAALGILASKWPVESLKCFMDPLWSNLISTSGVQRQVASMIIVSWFKEMKNLELSGSNVAYPALAEHFKSWLLDLLSCTDPSRPTKDTSLPYSELSRTYSKMQSEASHLFRAVESSGHFKDMLSIIDADLESIGVDDAINFASKIVAPGTDGNGEQPAVKHVFDELESLRQRLLTTAGYLKCVQNNLHVTVSALVAAAVVWMSGLPARLNPIILPLMASVKREQEEILQDKSAEALAKLIHDCISRKPGPNEKLIKNICSCTCMDPSETPQAGVINSMEVIDEQDLLSLKGMTGNQKSRTRSFAGGEDRSKVEGFVSRRGAELALKHLCERFGAFLFDKVPKLWECLTEVLKPVNVEVDANQERQIRMVVESINDPQVLINNLQVVRSVAPLLDDLLKPKLLALLPCIFKCVCYHHVAVRLAASRCIASMAKCMTVSVMAAVVENAIPMLRDVESVPARQGAGMLISLLVQGLGMELVPYAPLLVVPLLRCMSDSDPSVRQTVTRSFAALVPLLPLARGVPPPVGLSEAIVKDKEDAQFLEQLLDNSSIEDYKLSTELKVTLRRYQQEGINWLAFLRRFKLHGILCDDMGLGKTLQASAIVASDIAERHAANKCELVPPSLIVCPSTLVGHWAFEIEKYIDPSVINTLQYFGSTPERISLRSYFDQYRVIITSYDVVRKDVDYLGQLSWNYCILDEGHVIKNARSKITAAVKQLKAQHRLILSGTPIQNNILDLWSLFDFLMPGFLGSERQFQAAYGKPLVAARDSKCSKKDAEAGVLAMEALHKQVMPFLLRRTKDEVLSDLPEKIIQDRYCDLSPVQLKLYEQFSGVHVKKEISSLVGVNEPPDPKTTNGGPKETSHVFQALQYLLKLCSHPLLVVTEKIVDSLRSMTSELFPDSSHVMSELHNLHHSPKLVALQEILEECGIGVDASNSDGIGNVGQHRVLIFAQHKAFLDLIERDLFQTHMKSVTYLRLDGSVDANSRFNIAQAFNSDPTIDVLMLTTHSGGVGLNLTSADTLIFVEHDWNPMRDLQAMDRAHRLGQKKVVNVHRLIMRGTLEEKVMSLQRFKVSVANAVINSENASLKTMNTDQLLDLFTPDSRKKAAASISLNSDGSSSQNQRAGGGGKGLKAVLSSLEELWDPSQYSNEYNLKQFLDKLERS